MISTVRWQGEVVSICKDSKCEKLFTIFSGHGVTVSQGTESPTVLDRDGLRLF